MGAPGKRGGVAGAWERREREGGKITGGRGELAGTTNGNRLRFELGSTQAEAVRLQLY